MHTLIYLGGKERTEITDVQVMACGDALYFCNECEAYHIDPVPSAIENAQHVSSVIGIEVRA